MQRATPKLVQRIVREPLVHFGLLAIVIFLVHAALGAPEDEAPHDVRTVVVDPQYMEALREREAVGAGVAADPEEVEAAWIREEVLVREAIRLGIDRGDPVVRRRLVQKMELLMAADVTEEEIDEPLLARELAARADRYRAPREMAFEHVFLGRADDPDARAEDALARLRGGAAPASVSLPFLRGLEIGLRPVESIHGMFGATFAAAIDDAPLDVWSGPYESSYGFHLVRVTERRAAAVAPLSAVRARLISELLDERREREREARVDALIARYRIERVPSELR